MKRILLTLVIFGFMVSASSAQLVYRELTGRYDNGLSISTYADAIDTLVDNTSAHTIKVGLIRDDVARGAYPEFVLAVLEIVANINNGEKITMYDAQGFKDVTFTGALAAGDSTADAVAATQLKQVYNTSSATGLPGTNITFTINQLASAAATDSISYKFRCFGVYREDN